MSEEKKLYPLLAVSVIGSLGFSLVLPFLVFLVKKFGGNEVVYGFLGAIYPSFQLIGAPILGRWSDIYGRRIILLLSQLGTLCAWLIFLLALWLPLTEITQVDNGWMGQVLVTVPLLLLFFARALDGITGGNISVAQAYLADISTEENRQRNFGKMGAAGNIGFVTGPLLAGVLGSTVYEEALPVFAAIVVSTIGAAMIFFYLPESNQHSKQNLPFSFGKEKNEEEEAEPLKHISKKTRLWSIEGFPFMISMYFLIFLPFSFFYTAFPVHAALTLQWEMNYLSVFFTILSGGMIFVQGPLLTRLSKSFKSKTLVIVGSVFLTICFALLLSKQLLFIYLSAAFFALGNGLMWPSFLAIFSTLGHDAERGAIQGFGNSAGSLAMIIGMVFSGFCYQQIEEYTFMASAVLMAVIAVLSLKLKS